MRKMEPRSKQPSHSILSSGIRNLRPATTSLSHCRSEDGDVQQIAFTVPIETNRTGNHECLLFHNDGDQYFLSQVWLSGDKTDANSFPEFRKRRLRTAQTATRWLLARKPIHAELAGNGRMDRIDGAADPTASSSCLTSSKQSIGSAK